MQIAWTSALLASFLKDGTKPYFKQANGRFVRIDGEPKAWDLDECIKQRWAGADNAIAQNLRFFAGLRNKIEHREMPELDPVIFEECQAMLFNLEDFLVTNFGLKYSINQGLAFSLQFSRMFTEEQKKALRTLTKPLAGNVKDYVETFRSALSSSTWGDQRFSHQVFMLHNIGNNRSKDALAVEWVPYDATDPEKMKLYDAVAALVKTKHVQVLNPGQFKPGQVVQRVADAIAPRTFNRHHHAQAWKHFAVRPPSDSSQPELCQTQYCQYDAVHKDYVYTQAWIDLLSNELKADDVYKAVAAHGKQVSQSPLTPVAV